MPLLSNGPSRLLGGSKAKWYRAGGAPVPVAAYQPKGSASLAASYINLANPGTYNVAPGVAPTWSADTGWTFAGSQWLSSGLQPVAKTWSMFVAFSGLSGTVQCVAGAQTNAPVRFSLNPIDLGQHYYGIGGPGRNYFGNSLTAGVLAISGDRGYYNGAQEVTSSLVGGAVSYAIYIGALNNFGTPVNFVQGNIQAVAIYNSTLSGAQVAAVSLSMSQL